MTKEECKGHLPALKRAVDSVDEDRPTTRAKVWHDNERFLLQPQEYKKAGLQLERFPPNSGDLNPIETVWARLRKDLAKREQQDMAQGKTISASQFRSRAAQILKTYGERSPGQKHSYLQKLVRGMPERLRRCRLNKYGRCGK